MFVGKKMALTVEASSKLRNMAFLCACLVVCQHASVAKWCDRHIYILTRGAVPFFFCVSGFFITAHTGSRHWYRQALGKRVKTLLVPYLFFNVIWALIEFSHLGTLSWPDLLAAIGLNPVQWPIVGALW